MNISRINKDFVNRMNKFLTTGDIESFDGMFGITFSDFRIGPQGGSSVRDTSDNFISSLNDSNVTISEEECYAAFIAINFPEISTFNLPVKLIKFSEYADRFTNFRIDKFTSLLNDPNEMK